MTKEDFIKAAKQHNYTDEQIQDMLDLKEEQRKEIGFDMPYDKIILIDQPVY